MQKIKVVYISSLGHSGSTLLDIILSQHQKTISTGEIMFLDEWVEQNNKCTCGEYISDCTFWGNVLKKSVTPIGLISDKNYVDNSFMLFKKISKISDKKIIIDSSKSINRLKLLLSDKRMDVKVIHLVRNGYGVINSLKNSHRKVASRNIQFTPSTNIFFGTFRWLVRNLYLHMLMRKTGKDYIMVRYEDLCDNPKSELYKICRYVGLDFQEKMINPEIIDCHNIGGSRWRFKKNKIQIKLDEKWKGELGFLSKLFFLLFGGWLNKRYGY